MIVSPTLNMRALVVGLVCIATIQGKPLSDNDNKAGFKYPGGNIPGNFLEAREPDNLNGIYNKGGYGMEKTKRDDSAAAGGSGGSGSSGGNPMEQMSQVQQQFQGAFQNLQGGVPSNMFGGNMPFLSQSNKKEKREDAAAGGSGGSGGSGGNPMEQMSQVQQQFQGAFQNLQGGVPSNMFGGNMPFLSQSNKKEKREDAAAGGSGGSGGSGGNPMEQMSQVQQQFQGAFQNLQGGVPSNMFGGNMPFLSQSNKKEKREDAAAGGSGGSGGSGGNPMEQMSQVQQQFQGAFQNLQGGVPSNMFGGNMPFLSQSNKKEKREDAAAGGSGGSGGSGGNPMEQMSQVQQQFQGAFQNLQGGVPSNMFGGNMPFLSQGNKKEKRQTC